MAREDYELKITKEVELISLMAATLAYSVGMGPKQAVAGACQILDEAIKAGEERVSERIVRDSKWRRGH